MRKKYVRVLSIVFCVIMLFSSIVVYAENIESTENGQEVLQEDTKEDKEENILEQEVGEDKNNEEELETELENEENNIVEENTEPEEGEIIEESLEEQDNIEELDNIEEQDITKEDISEYSFTKEYIEENLNSSYIKEVNKFQVVNGITTKISIFDGNYVGNNEDLDSVFSDWENLQNAYIASTGGLVPVFDVNIESEYYVALVNTMFNDNGYTLQDYDFAKDSLSGEVLEEAILDENEIGYIPKKYFSDEIAKVQCQIMQVSKQPESMISSVVVEEVENTETVSTFSNSIPYEIEEGNVFDFETVINIESGLDLSRYVIKVNEIPVNKSYYTYDSNTGRLVLEMDPSTIATVSIEEAEESEIGLLSSLNEARATNSQLPHIPGSITGVPSDLWDRLDRGEQPVYTGKVEYVYTNHKPNEFQGWIAWSANLNSDIKNLANQIKNGGVDISKVEYSPSDLNYLMYFSREPELPGWSFDDVFNVILKCGHISDPFTETPNTSASKGKVKIYFRVIGYDKASSTVTISILTDRTHTQSGVGVFRVSTKIPNRKGSFEVHKISSNSNITDGNGNYSLYGAVYGVYTDRNCTKLVGYITTNDKGVAKAEVDVGTYYVKEYQASPGYLLDTNVYEVQAN